MAILIISNFIFLCFFIKAAVINTSFFIFFTFFTNIFLLSNVYTLCSYLKVWFNLLHLFEILVIIAFDSATCRNSSFHNPNLLFFLGWPLQVNIGIWFFIALLESNPLSKKSINPFFIICRIAQVCSILPKDISRRILRMQLQWNFPHLNPLVVFAFH